MYNDFKGLYKPEILQPLLPILNGGHECLNL